MTAETLSRQPRIGVRFEPDWEPEKLPGFARWAEQAGFDELWFSEDLPWAGGVAMTATALAATTRLHVGLGLLPAVTRNVVTTAMEVAAICRLAPGRLTLGLGNGIPAWMDQIGAGVPRRFTALEETAEALSVLLAGDELTMNGHHVRVQGVRLGFPPAEVPDILLGTTGPTGLAVSGRAADGVVLPEITSPDAVRWARREMDAAGSAGRTALLAMVSLDEDRGRALAQVRNRMQRIVEFGVFSNLTALAGLGEDGRGVMTDEILQSLTAAGTPDDALRAVEDWAAAGTDTVVLVAGADDPIASYRTFAAEVLPRLRS
jgi:alkanesulfonate monooxygenase SsuD/methylene tetrahydromethanopterin reductase-like flavin-dependent oxidoreductase (luciferase family)